MKHSIKLLMFALAAGVIVSSCSNPDKISSSAIVRQVNSMMKKTAMSESFATITVGKYECNDSYKRRELREMDAAGLISYSVKRYPWWEKSKKTISEPYEALHYSYYWGTYTTTEYRTVKKDRYDFEDHYVVDIALTKLGEKAVVPEYPEAEPEEDVDLRKPNVDPSTYAWNKVDLNEVWPEIPNPFLKQETKAASETSKSKSSSTSSSSVSTPKTPYVERVDSLNFIAYNKLSFNSSEVIVKTGSVKAIKARNIQILDVNGVRKARAEVILSKCKVTDFGRILDGIENNERNLIEVTLTYYLDKGWVLDK